MASRKAYRKALRAAKSVVAGRKQKTSTALAGLALVAFLPACPASDNSKETDASQDVTTFVDGASTDVEQVLTDINDILSADSNILPDEGNTVQEVASADEGSTPVDEGSTPVDEGSTPVDEGSTPVDEGSTPVDEGSTPVDEGSTADAGWVNSFPDTCLHPTGQACDDFSDCDVTGSECIDAECMAGSMSYAPTGQACAGPDQCGEEGLCMSNQCFLPSEASLLASECCDEVLDDKGCMQPTDIPCDEETGCEGDFAQLECIDNVCHASQLSMHPMAAHAESCCFAFYALTGCNTGIPMGCYPWGPPAPPTYNGIRLRDLLRAEAA
ncbi:MAG: hypothetical protein CMH54_09340 [Myxococcales bacterium]|nr:hypothetical protein [Myxococcales bacterium]